MNRLAEILSTMDVPPGRLNDFNWLLRNLSFRNWEHPKFIEALTLIREQILIQLRVADVPDNTKSVDTK